ncbi:MAG: hypothetical protein SFU25_11095 [Candidatus Caenarcaniphilales bacterium]|nr:hypothetical protein [Candidatus Caenarcaniphilales bacterium]
MNSKKSQMRNLYSKIFLCLIFVCSLPLASRCQDFAIALNESLLNKVISSKKIWEYEDKVQGIYIKLSNLKFNIVNGNIVGSAKVNQFKQLNSSSSGVIAGLMPKLIQNASDMNDVGTIKLQAQVGLSESHQKIILKNTKFTSFDNRYLPRFIEDAFVLKELNKKFAKEIDGKIIYEFPKSFAVDILDVRAVNKEIIIDGNLALQSDLGEFD